MKIENFFEERGQNSIFDRLKLYETKIFPDGHQRQIWTTHSF